MKNTQLLLINDMCGYGKVALSAMLPVLSHMGYRIHNLPTALVSDTLNYPKFYIHDTTEYVRQSLAIWEELGFEFDAISTGFIVTEEEARIISDFCHRRSQKGTKVFVDPIMADNGRLYAGVPESTIGLMRSLVECADYAVPNYTEACLLTDTPMAEQITADEARALVDAMLALGAKSVVITSAKVDGASAVIGYDHVAGEYFTIPFELIPVYFPGTGDTFSSVLVGRVMAGWSLQRATTDAMRVVAELIERNADQEDKSAGLPIEACLDVIDHEYRRRGRRQACGRERAARCAAWQASAYPRELRGPAGCVPLSPWSQAGRRLRLRSRPRQDVRYGLSRGLSLYRYPALRRNRAWQRARYGKVLLPRGRYAERLACRGRRRVAERNVTKGQFFCHIRGWCPFFLLIISNLCISSDFRF